MGKKRCQHNNKRRRLSKKVVPEIQQLEQNTLLEDVFHKTCEASPAIFNAVDNQIRISDFSDISQEESCKLESSPPVPTNDRLRYLLMSSVNWAMRLLNYNFSTTVLYLLQGFTRLVAIHLSYLLITQKLMDIKVFTV